MGYQINLLGNSQSTQKSKGLVEVQSIATNQAKSTQSSIGYPPFGFTLNSPFIPITSSRIIQSNFTYNSGWNENAPYFQGSSVAIIGSWDDTRYNDQFSNPQSGGVPDQFAIGGWVSFVSQFSTNSTNIWAFDSRSSLHCVQHTFGGVVFNFMLFQWAADGSYWLFGTEVLATGTVSGDLNALSIFFNLVGQGYNLLNTNPLSSAQATSFLTNGPFIAPLPSGVTHYFTTSVSNNSLLFTPSSQLTTEQLNNNVTGSLLPWLLLAFPTDISTPINVSNFGQDLATNSNIQFGRIPSPTFGSPAVVTLSGITFDAAGDELTGPYYASILNQNIANTNSPIGLPYVGALPSNLKDNTTITLDPYSASQMGISGFTAGIPNILLNWFPVNGTTTLPIVVTGQYQNNAVYIRHYDQWLMNAYGFQSPLILTINNVNYQVTWNGTNVLFGSNPNFPTIAPGTAGVLSGVGSQSFANVNSGYWPAGTWDGNQTITFNKNRIPKKSVPLVLNQPLTLLPVNGKSKGSYNAWLYDATYTIDSKGNIQNGNPIHVSSQLDLDQDRNDIYVTAPIIQLRADNTLNTDSTTQQPLYPYQTSNQQTDIQLTYQLSNQSTVLGKVFTLSLSDSTAMLTAGYDFRLPVKVKGNTGGYRTAMWDGGLIIQLDQNQPNNFSPTFTVFQQIQPDNKRIAMTLDPVVYSKGLIKLKFSGSVDNTVNLQVAGGFASFPWPLTDETIANNAFGSFASSSFEASLSGNGDIIVVIPFTITAV